MSQRHLARLLGPLGLLLVVLGPAPAATPVLLAGGTLVIRDGATGRELPWKWAKTGTALTARDAQLTCRLQPGQAGGLGLLSVRLKNTGPAPRRLQFEFATTRSWPRAGVRYWDGGIQDQNPVPGVQPDDQLEVETNLHVPLAAAGDPAGALLLGLTPDTFCSYSHPLFDYRPGRSSRFGLTIRYVLEPGQEDGFTLCAGAVPGVQYGLMAAAWEAYQRAFPTFFRPAPGVCDNIWGASAEYQSWGSPPNLEQQRRLGVTWDWCYTPFKRVGDIWARDEEWDYKPLAAPFDAQVNHMLGRQVEIGKETAAGFREERQKYFETYGDDAGLMFYHLAMWVEKQLAQEKFADALVVDKARRTELSSWCRYHDTELAVMPMGTSYEPRIVGDMERVARELRTPGFALDVFLNRERNHSELVAKTPLPGRAWDDEGVYQDIGISLAQLADRIHQVQLTDRPYTRPALVGGNGTTGFHTDCTLYELTFYGADKRNYPLWRMSMGQKPGVIWQGYDIPHILPNWERMSRPDFMKALWGITDYVRLKCFQWGIFPTASNLLGVGRFQADMPLLTELIKLGWHPQAPVTVTPAREAYVWPARYSQGAGSCLVLGSPNEAAVPAQVVVANDLLGTTNALFVNGRAPGEWLAQSVAGRQTRLQATLPRRDLVLLRGVLGLSGADVSARARLAQDLDGATVTVEVTAARAAQVRLETPALPGYEVTGLHLNGQPVADRARVRLPAGKSTLQVTQRRRFLHFTAAQLARLPFLTDAGKLNFAFTATNADPRTTARVRTRLVRYFEYYARTALKVSDPGAVADTPAAGQLAVTLELSPANTGWTLAPDGLRLTLVAADEATAVRHTSELLTALDARYPLAVPYSGGMMGMYHPVQLKHQMIGKTLEQMLAEEGIQ